MKIGILGDIHGNSIALEAVLLSAKAKNVSELLITGDLVGYYFRPNEVLRLLKKWNCYIVRGNHEEMLGLALDDYDYLKSITNRYGPGLSYALNQLNQEQISFLTQLPHPLVLSLYGRKILLCHGSPADLNTYLYPDSENFKEILGVNFHYDLIVTGHTHYPMDINVGNARIVNPGSVGQPRNRIPGAHWVLFDLDKMTAEFYVEEYDSTALIMECRERAPSLPYLADVLIRR